jgi:hypothetical protein
VDERKAKIIRIGTVTDDGVVSDWVMDGTGPFIDIHGSEVLAAGYTVDELREIAREGS